MQLEGFIAYPGHKVTLDGSGLALNNWDGMVHLDGLSHIRVSGFNIINTHEAGIHIDNSVSITIEKNTITLDGLSLSPIKVGWGYSSDIIVNGNTVSRSTDPSCNGDSVRYCWEEMISISNGERIQVHNNHVLLNGVGEGIVLKDGTKNSQVFNNNVENTKAGIYVGGWQDDQYNMDVYNNILQGNTFGILIGSEMGGIMQYINIFNNILYDNRGSGITISSYSAGTAYPPQIKDVSITNNSLFNNGIGSWGGGGIQIEAERGMNMRISNISIKNNIVSKNNDYQIGIESGSPYVEDIVVDYNLVDGTKGYYENDGTNLVVADPGFIDRNNGDFHLGSSSTAIDKGTSDGAPSFDFDGNTRPNGSGVDMGAFEYKVLPATTPALADRQPSRRAPNRSISSGGIHLRGLESKTRLNSCSP